MQGRADAKAFGRYPGAYCRTAGGTVVNQDGGGRFCAFWIEEPPRQGG